MSLNSGEYPTRFVEFGSTRNSPYYKKESETGKGSHRWLIPRGGGQPILLYESRRLGPTNESSCLQLDSEAEGQVIPNWKTLGRNLGIYPPKFLRYLVWKFLFEPEEVLLTPTLVSHIESLIPDFVTIRAGDAYSNRTHWKEVEKGRAKEKFSLWELNPDHENLLYARILSYILPDIMFYTNSNLKLTKLQRRLLLGFLREHGKDHFALKRAFHSQKTLGHFEKVITKVSFPMKPKRRRPRPPRRRRSSEDRSGKPGRSKLGVKSGTTLRYEWYLERDPYGIDPPIRKWREKPEDPFAKKLVRVDPRNSKAIDSYYESLINMKLLRRRRSERHLAREETDPTKGEL